MGVAFEFFRDPTKSTKVDEEEGIRGLKALTLTSYHFVALILGRREEATCYCWDVHSTCYKSRKSFINDTFCLSWNDSQSIKCFLVQDGG
ncbi:hypothetical protein PanWU01x14_249110 [Parasponia andersonii]|uniref:Uncharacterized protein n=1 Tax=Parasponia andersonii TaxID=3476 RepID=A0A2P5BDI2_PARAD|nr:hypothetical protein PanWU01x14_249110 [Parasponia andersonii]